MVLSISRYIMINYILIGVLCLTNPIKVNDRKCVRINGGQFYSDLESCEKSRLETMSDFEVIQSEGRGTLTVGCVDSYNLKHYKKAQ